MTTSDVVRPDQPGNRAPRRCGECDTPVRASGRFCGACGRPIPPASIPPASGPPASVPSASIPPASIPSAATPSAADPSPTGAPEPPARSGATRVLPPDDDAGWLPTVQNDAGREPAAIPDPTGTAARGTRRRWPLLVAAAVAVLVLGGVGWSVAGEVQKRASHSAVQETSATIATLLGSVEEAAGLDDLATQRGAVEAADAEAEQALDRARQRRPSQLRTAVTEVLGHERDVLAALASLTDVGADTLGDWPAVRTALVDSVEARDDAAAELAALDGLRGDADRAVGHVEDLVAATVLPEVAPAILEAAVALSSAGSLAELNEVGRAFAATNDLLSPHVGLLDAGAVPAGSPRATLRRHAELVGTLAAMAELHAQDLDDWTGISSGASELVDDLDGDDATAEALREGLASVDGLVDGWMERFGAWQAEVREARNAQATDRRAVRDYEAEVGRILDEYDELRDELAEFVNEVETSDEAYFYGYGALWHAREGREDVRDSLRALAVPPGLDAPHEHIVGLLDRAIAAIELAEDGLDATYSCWDDCVAFADTAQWRTFMSTSEGFATEYDAAVEGLDAAIAAALDQIDGRDFPAAPEF